MPTASVKPLRAVAGERRVRQMNFDLLRLLEGNRQGSHGTMRNRMAHLRWVARQIGKPGIVRKDNASYGIGTDGA